MYKKIFVAVNPVAGNAEPEILQKVLEGSLAGRDLEFFETTGSERLPEVARQAVHRGFDLVVAAGGDGTVSGVAGGVVNTEVPLAIIPSGTGNVLAQELGIPLDMEGATALIAEPHGRRAVDAMRVRDQYFLLNVGAGLSSLTIDKTEWQAKRPFGRLAYFWVGLAQILGLRLHPFTLVIDGTQTRVRANDILITNSNIIGMQPFQLGPDVHPDDGKVEVCLLRARTLLDYVRAAWSLLPMNGKPRGLVYCQAAEHEILIDSNRPFPVQADGELIGETPVRVEVVKGAVQVVVPD